MSDKKLSVAFIGTGIMGAPIAGHILDAGYPVTVYNRTKAKTDDHDIESHGVSLNADHDVIFSLVSQEDKDNTDHYENRTDDNKAESVLLVVVLML